jgi:hypothetical protein
LNDKPFAQRKVGRLEFAIVKGLDIYARDIVAPVVHSIEESWVSYVVYPHRQEEPNQ